MMKKLLFACLVGALSLSSAYAACPEDNGQVVTTTVAGKEKIFCVTPHKHFNWWSAASYCQAIGMKLATMKDICPNWTYQSNYGSNGCDDLNLTYSIWTATAHDTTKAYYYDKGNIYTDYRTSERDAFCI